MPSFWRISATDPAIVSKRVEEYLSIMKCPPFHTTFRLSLWTTRVARFLFCAFYIASSLAGLAESNNDPRTIHVVPDIACEGDGSETNPVGGIHNALRLAEAMARENQGSSTKGKPAGFRLLLAGGRYELASTVEINVTSVSPLMFEASGDSEVIISGGVKLPNRWDTEQINGQEVWSQTLPEVANGNWYFHQLWVNGERAHVPTMPKEGFYQISELIIPEEHKNQPKSWEQAHADRFVYKDNQFEKGWHAIEDVWLMMSYSWFQQALKIKHLDPTSRTVYLNDSTVRWLLASHPAHGRYVNENHPTGHDPDNFHVPAFYQIFNVLEALTEPGEFYVDRKTGKLYYKPREGEDPETVEVIAPRLHQLFVIRGRGNKHVSGIHFRNITFSHSQVVPEKHRGTGNHPDSSPPAAIYFEKVRNVSFRECTFRHFGEYALGFMKGSQDVDVVGNTFEDLGVGAIKTLGEFPTRQAEWVPDLVARRKEILEIQEPEKFASQIRHAKISPETTMRIRITDNLVRRTNRFFRPYTVISLSRTRNSVVAHNRIEDTYFNAIKTNATDQGMDFSAVDVKVLHNAIANIGQGHPSANDMGGIYLGGYGLGVLVEGNVIRNVTCYMYGGNGIYIDGYGPCHFTLRNNLIMNCNYNGIHLKGHSQNVVNNIVYDCERAISQMTRYFDVPFAYVERNILAPKSSVVFTSRELAPSELSIRSESNLLWSLSAGADVKVSTFGQYGQLNPVTMSFEAWRAEFGLDKGSIISPVELVRSADGSFELNPAAMEQAVKLGFVPFKPNAGPRPIAQRSEVSFYPDNHSLFSPAFRSQVAFVLEKLAREDQKLKKVANPADPLHVD
jgi:hypothetical protein